MKKLLFLIILMFILSCEKSHDIDSVIERNCWSCRFQYIGEIADRNHRYCNKSDIGIPGSSEITESEIRQFVKDHEVTGMIKVICISYKE